jgi:alpha-beta hydrolase superfamily lysophospholipase
VEAFRHDALKLYDYLVDEQGVDPERLVVWGHSLGSFLATHVAQQRSVAGVVLENPATNVDGWVDHLIPWYVRLFLGVDVDPALKAEDNVARVRSLDAPLVVVAGKEDNVTDPAMAKQLYKKAGSAEKTFVLVPDGGHNDLYEEADVQKAYADLVDRIVNGAPESTTGR